MPEYYPEIFLEGLTVVDDIIYPAREFPNDEDAISYYKSRFGPKLEAVVRDEAPEIVVVWRIERV